jgi:hypothetical protein
VMPGECGCRHRHVSRRQSGTLRGGVLHERNEANRCSAVTERESSDG